MYAVENSTFGGGKGRRPAYLQLEVYRLQVPLRRPLIILTCAFNARNAE